MDNRLALLLGKRPSRLRRQDLPDVATAITAYIRGYPVLAGPTDAAGVRSMVFRSDCFEVAVLMEDWAKIDPYVRADAFSPTLYPPSAGYALSDPFIQLTPSMITSDLLYKRVLDVLTLLFPDAYPTSDY